MAAAQGEIQSLHRYKLQPPYFTGDYATFEEWKHKMVAYLGLQNSEFPRLLQTAEQTDIAVTDELLRDGASNMEEARLWVQLSKDLHYILVSVCSGQAAVICRQHSTQAQGLETWRQLHSRFSIPIGTRSVGYLTKLLKPQFDEQKFEESFTTWEFEIARYERDNQAPIPDNIKIAVLLNETKGALQQHLQLRAGTIQRYADVRELILEYHRASTAFARMQAQQQALNNTTNNSTGPQPMDVSLLYKGKGKHKGKGKGGKGSYKGKGSWQSKGKGYNNNYNYGKGKPSTPIGQSNNYKGYTPNKGGYKGKGSPTRKGDNKGKSKGACYRCGQMGHMAKDCRVRVYNVGEATDDTTGEQQRQQFYEEQYNHQAYDPPWSEQQAWQYEQQWYPEQNGQEYNQQPPTLQQAQAVSSVKVEELFVASVTSTDLNTDATVAIMVDSGAAVHVCSPTFGAAFPLQPLKPADTPPLRSVTDEPLKILGYRWIRFYNKQGQQLVIPFYVCEGIQHPIVSVTRLLAQGFQLTLTDNCSAITKGTDFNIPLAKKNQLLYMHLELAPLEQGYNLIVQNTTNGQKVLIAPAHTDTRTAHNVQGGNDYWKYNEQGFLIRVHKRSRKALFVPGQGKQGKCPVPLNRFDNYRKTVIQRGSQQAPLVLEDQYQTLTNEQKNREPTGGLWQGETWFRILPEQGKDTAMTTGEQKEQGIQQQQGTGAPVRTRYTGKQAEKPTTIPTPEKVQHTTDYWLREGRHWKRVHVKPRTEFYTPTPEDNGPDINRLLPYRATHIPEETARMDRIHKL